MASSSSAGKAEKKCQEENIWQRRPDAKAKEMPKPVFAPIMAQKPKAPLLPQKPKTPLPQKPKAPLPQPLKRKQDAVAPETPASHRQQGAEVELENAKWAAQAMVEAMAKQRQAAAAQAKQREAVAQAEMMVQQAGQQAVDYQAMQSAAAMIRQEMLVPPTSMMPAPPLLIRQPMPMAMQHVAPPPPTMQPVPMSTPMAMQYAPPGPPPFPGPSRSQPPPEPPHPPPRRDQPPPEPEQPPQRRGPSPKGPKWKQNDRKRQSQSHAKREHDRIQASVAKIGYQIKLTSNVFACMSISTMNSMFHYYVCLKFFVSNLKQVLFFQPKQLSFERKNTHPGEQSIWIYKFNPVPWQDLRKDALKQQKDWGRLGVQDWGRLVCQCWCWESVSLMDGAEKAPEQVACQRWCCESVHIRSCRWRFLKHGQDAEKASMVAGAVRTSSIGKSGNFIWAKSSTIW